MSKIIIVICLLIPFFLGIEFIEYRIWFALWLFIMSVFFLFKTVNFHSFNLFKFKFVNFGIIIVCGLFFFNFIIINGTDINNYIFAGSVLLCSISMSRIIPLNTSSKIWGLKNCKEYSGIGYLSKLTS